ncbi:MAG: NAD(P)-dependent oxidoreductase [Betaproteobacteria bacterium]|nr:NAD(P)-dependent oxidoreductase [Betaproteobacteria bacterium]
MTTLVTGGTGFVGLNVLEQLLTRGDEIVCLAVNPLPGAAAREFAKLPGKLHIVQGDITDPGSIEAALERFGCKRMIHAAAITAGTARDETDPTRIVEVNLLGTINALKAARKAKIERFIYPSTGGHFGEAGINVGHYLDEDADHPVPNSMYGISKYAAERGVLRLGALWGMDVRIGRVAVVYGRWEYETGLRDAMTTILQATRLAMTGREAVFPRLGPADWIYAPDLARALLVLLDATTTKHRLYHLAIEAPFDMTAWCERLRKRYPSFSFRESARIEECNIAPLAPFRTPFSGRRLREEFGFKPAFTLDSAFDDYTQWLAAHPK